MIDRLSRVDRFNRSRLRFRFGRSDNWLAAAHHLFRRLALGFLAADLGFEPMPDSQHAAYIQSWLQALQNDKRFIFQAASHAQKAVEYLHSLQPF